MRFILFHLVSSFVSHHEAEYDLDEMKSLVETSGGATIVRVIQRRMKPDNSTFIGKGKAEEIKSYIQQEKIDAVCINAIVNPTQLFHLKQLYWDANPNIEVWDRIDLILYIFKKNAMTAEAKLQIELARMRHMGPRIYGLGSVLSRQAGGIGGRGIGETNIELMKRHWRREMRHIQERLLKLERDHMDKLERRKEAGFQTVSIVGYTNAGKTSLFNLLTAKQKLSKDSLFATLDSTVGKLYLSKKKQEVLVTDTIGFIQNLPPQLIDAFKSTLMETVHADLLLHVIDASDYRMHEKISVVEEVLHDLGVKNIRQIYVFNKIDMVSKLDKKLILEQYKEFAPQFISVKQKKGIDSLIHEISR